MALDDVGHRGGAAAGVPMSVAAAPFTEQPLRPRLCVSTVALVRSIETEPFWMAEVLPLARPPPMKTFRFCANWLPGVQPDGLCLAVDFGQHTLEIRIQRSAVARERAGGRFSRQRAGADRATAKCCSFRYRQSAGGWQAHRWHSGYLCVRTAWPSAARPFAMARPAASSPEFTVMVKIRSNLR